MLEDPFQADPPADGGLPVTGHRLNADLHLIVSSMNLLRNAHGRSLTVLPSSLMTIPYTNKIYYRILEASSHGLRTSKSSHNMGVSVRWPMYDVA